jgi:hypothetical protein
MFVRGLVSAATLLLLQVCGAQAGGQHGVSQRMSCSEVRYYVAKYSIVTAEMYARSRGATEAQINAARRCLTDERGQSAQRS